MIRSHTQMWKLENNGKCAKTPSDMALCWYETPPCWFAKAVYIIFQSFCRGKQLRPPKVSSQLGVAWLEKWAFYISRCVRFLLNVWIFPSLARGQSLIIKSIRRKLGGNVTLAVYKSEVLFSEGFTEIRGRLPFNTLRKTSRSELHPGSILPQIRSKKSKMLCIYSLQYLLESTVIYSRGALQNK